MSLDNLIILKSEIPILHGSCFEAPIHPRLLNPDIKIDRNIARTFFPRVAEEWYNDLTEHLKELEEGEEKEWMREIFLRKKPEIKKEYGKQVLDTMQWEDKLDFSANGFASGFSISRNAGGGLFFNTEDSGCKTYVPFNGSNGYIRFSRDKALEFSIDSKIIKSGNGREGTNINIYAPLNIDYYPGALFLRNWAILYLNEALKQSA